jgi:hypothetical protein
MVIITWLTVHSCVSVYAYLLIENYVVWCHVSISVCPVLCMCRCVLLWNDYLLALLFARSRLFNLHLLRSLAAPFLSSASCSPPRLFFCVGDVGIVIFGSFLPRQLSPRHSYWTYTHIHKFNYPWATDRQRTRRKREHIQDYVYCPDRRSPTLSFSLIQLVGQSSPSSLRNRHTICSIVVASSEFFLHQFIIYHLLSIKVCV